MSFVLFFYIWTLSLMYCVVSNLSAVCTLYRTLALQYCGGITNYKVSEEAMSETDDCLLTAATA